MSKTDSMGQGVRREIIEETIEINLWGDDLGFIQSGGSTDGERLLLLCTT